MMIAGTVGTVGFLSFRHGQKGVNDLAAQLQDSLQDRIKHELDELLSKPHALNRINAEALRSGLVNPRDFSGQRVRFLQQVQSFPSVITCAFGSAGGDFIGAGWRSEGVFDSALADKAVDNDYRVFILDEQGQPAELVDTVRDYDPRSRSWYQGALKAGGATWSPAYIWASQQNIGISAVVPVYDRAGALMGVQLSALSLGHISRFLGSLQIGKSGQAFIVERSGMLVASSVESSIRPSPEIENATAERFQAVESASPLIRSAVGYLIERHGHFDRIVGVERMRVAFAGENYFLNVAPFSDHRGLEWLIAVIVSESDFMAHVEANARSHPSHEHRGFGCGSFVGRVCCAVAHAADSRAQCGRPRDESGKMASNRVPERFHEVGQLAASFNRMGDQLREAFETLERRVRERTHELASANEQLNTEIVERKQAEEALRASEEKYRTLFQNMAEEVHFWQLVRDEHGQIKTWRLVDVNPPTLKTWGRQSVDEVLGKTTDEIFGSGATEHYLSIVQQIMTEGVPHSFEDYFPNLDKYFRFTSVPLGEYFITTGADVTGIKKAELALRESEQRFRIAEQLAKMGHFEWDVVNNVIVASPSLERIYGLEPGGFKGRYEDWLTMVYSEDRTRVYEIVQSAFAEKRREERFEFRIVRPDGDVRWNLLQARATYDESGRPLRVMGAMTDITDTKKAEEALKKAHDELENRVQDRTAELSQALEKLRVENIQCKLLEDTLRESENQVRFFASQCLTAQETERKRIAGELHDSIAASLGAVRLRIDKVAEEMKKGPCGPESLQDLASAVTEINQEVRRIMADLRPSILDDLGIIPAMNWFCREYQKTYSHISVENQIGISEHEVPDSLKTPIFRICQEAMNNIAKYSKASLVNLSLKKRRC